MSDEELVDHDLADAVEELASVFAGTMQSVRYTEPVGPASDVRAALEGFLTQYVEMQPTTAFGQHDELKNSMNLIQRGLQTLSAVRLHPNVLVSWSLGAGNWARIPWIALMDDRETTSTQRGTYVVFLFPEDMSGVYLTLNQGVTDVVNEHSRSEGRQILANRARAVRERVRSRLVGRFALEGTIDLKTDGALGLDYEAATIAQVFYRRDEIPDTDQINDDLSALLAAYEDVLKGQRLNEELPSRSAWIFEVNPKFFDIDGALRSLDEMTWTAQDQARRAAAGDEVFIWRSGTAGGVVAVATVVEAASDRESLPDEADFVLDRERLGVLVLG